MQPHLDDDLLGAFTEGILTEAEGRALVAHADRCDPCRQLLAEVGRDLGVVPGTRIDRFIVLAQAGIGGMGIVYTAHDPKLGRKVALKLLRPEQAGPEGGARLLEEARAAAQLAHPNVVTVFEVGAVGDEVFIAMEYVEGGTLRQWLAERRRSARGILGVLTDAGRGLAAAHAAGLVHGDFKPDNVLVGPLGRARVTDFGLALGPPGRRESAVGTPAYMAPEQRDRGTGGPSSDQFSFCVTACEALFGQRGAVGARRGVSSRVRRALERGLAEDPAVRHESMDALVAQLRHRSRATRPEWIAAALLLGAAASAGASWLTRAQTQERCTATAQALVEEVWNDQARGAMRDAFLSTRANHAGAAFASSSARLDAYAARLVRAGQGMCREPSGSLPAALTRARPDCVQSRLQALDGLVQVFRRADSSSVHRAVDASDDLPRVEACVDGSAELESFRSGKRITPERTARFFQLVTRAWAEDRAGRAGAARELVSQARELAKELGHPGWEAKALLLEVRTARRSDPAAAVRMLHEALVLAQRAGDDLRVAEAAVGLMFKEGYERNDPARGHFWDSVAVATLERVGNDPILEANRLNNLGSLFMAQSRYEEALRAYGAVVSSAERLFGPDTVPVAVAANNHAGALARLERYSEAEAAFRRVVAMRERTQGSDHPALIGPLLNVAELQLARSKHDAAYATAMKAVALIERNGAGPRQTAEVWMTVSRVHSALGRHADALAALDRVGHPPPSHGADRIPASLLDTRAGLLLEKGDPLAALHAAEQAVQTLAKVADADDPDLVRGLALQGEAERRLNRDAAALKTLRRAKALAEGARGQRSVRAQLRFSLAQLLWKSPAGRAEAHALAKEALTLREAVPEDSKEAAKVRQWLTERASF